MKRFRFFAMLAIAACVAFGTTNYVEAKPKAKKTATKKKSTAKKSTTKPFKGEWANEYITMELDLYGKNIEGTDGRCYGWVCSNSGRYADQHDITKVYSVSDNEAIAETSGCGFGDKDYKIKLTYNPSTNKMTYKVLEITWAEDPENPGWCPINYEDNVTYTNLRKRK